MPLTHAPELHTADEVPDWHRISRLVAGDDTVGRALLGDDPALEPAGAGAADAAGAGPVGRARARPVPGAAAAGAGLLRVVDHAPFLLVEPVEPVLVREPTTGRVSDLNVDLLVQRGCGRFRPDAPVPAPAGWTLSAGPTWFKLCDPAGQPWAYPTATAPNAWWLAADRLRYVVVLYGAWVGIRPPRGVPGERFGPAQRAAELRAGGSRGLVAVTTAAWHP
jgi:hypothetical protein